MTEPVQNFELRRNIFESSSGLGVGLIVKKLNFYTASIVIATLILLTTPASVISAPEKTATAVIVRQQAASGPYEGNTLIPDRDNHGVIEIDPNGEILRVNLRVYRKTGGDRDTLTEICLSSSRDFQPDKAAFPLTV